jgi:hypothetical protein
MPSTATSGMDRAMMGTRSPIALELRSTSRGKDGGKGRRSQAAPDLYSATAAAETLDAPAAAVRLII